MSTIRTFLLAFLSLVYPATLAAQTGALVFIKSGDAWIMNTDGSEPPRLSWRLQQMRRWSHDEREDESIFA